VKKVKKRYKSYHQSLRAFSRSEDTIIRNMRKRGATGVEIARELHCHKGAVHRRLREMGLSYVGFWTAKRAEQKKKSRKAA
jgi:DNA invertase Pin-like site-specific DNA recombinase